MARVALRKVEDQLHCIICLETFKDPKTLQCSHVYCCKCLVSLVVRNSKEELVLPCPVCRKDTPIPAGGVASLQPAFHMNRLFEIRNALQQQGDDPVPENEDGQPGDKELAEAIVSRENAEAARIYCSEHPEKGVELYCECCSELICVNCITKGGKHLSHNHELLGEAFENYKQSIC